MTTEEQTKLREERRLKLCALMKENKITGSAVGAHSHIGSGSISLMMSGKQPITDKTWTILNDAIEDILDRRGVPVANPTPTPIKPIAVSVPKVAEGKSLVQQHMWIALSNFENTLIHKKDIEGKEDTFLEELKSKYGYNCSLINNGNCWIVHRAVVIEDLPEVKDHWDVEAIPNMASIVVPAEVAMEGITITPDVAPAPIRIEAEDIPQSPAPKIIQAAESAISVEEQIAYIKNLSERNLQLLESADLLGYSSTLVRIRNDQPVLDHILITLRNLTVDKPATFEEHCQAVADYLVSNYNPHTTVVITTEFAKVVMDEMGFPMNGYPDEKLK